MTDVIYETTVDKGTWLVKVLGTDEKYKGLLTVEEVETKQIIHEEEVSLSYGAIFGPDIEDVAQWQDTVIDVIDHPEKRKRGV